MDSIKVKIRKCVSDYKKLFPDEYAAAVKQIAEGRKLNKDQFASTRDKRFSDGHALDRKIHEMPETLYGMIDSSLTEEEMKTFGEKKTAFWFAKTYKEFASFETL